MSFRNVGPLRRWVIGLFLFGAMGCTGGGGSEDAGPVEPQPPAITVPTLSYVATRSAVVLRAEGTDANGDAITWQWAQKSGSTVNLGGANTQELTFTAPSAKGDLTFEVTATDATSAQTKVLVTVAVHRVSNDKPFAFVENRRFTYQAREQVYTWQTGTTPLSATAPAAVGTVTLAVEGKETVNGIDIWTVAVADDSPEPAAACNPTNASATECPNPNQFCSSEASQCRSNKRKPQTVKLVQLNDQLYSWTDVYTHPLLVVDPTRPVASPEQPVFFEGFELMSADIRVDPHAPRTPLRFLGTLTVEVPGDAVPDALVTDGDTAAVVEIFDGVKRTDVLSPYHATRAFYAQGKALVFFQAEDVPDGFAATAQVGYRDLVLTGIEPPL